MWSPQGSLLGLLLFIIYINDIVNVSELANLILFAGDTNMFLSNTNLHSLIANTNSELNKLSTWFKIHKHSLNIKTNFIVFRNGGKIRNIEDVKTKIDNNVIIEVTCTTFS